MHNEIEYLLKAMDIGVDGYILKESEFSELKKAINAVLSLTSIFLNILEI